VSEHEHHHETLSCIEELASLDLAFEAHEHEGSVAVSCTLQPKESCQITFSQLIEVLVSATEDLEAAGAFIGHVKAIASEGPSSASASLTDLAQGAAVKGDSALVLGPSTQVQAVAIVVGMSLEQTLSLFCFSLHKAFATL